MLDAHIALEKLKIGNQKFVDSLKESHLTTPIQNSPELIKAQHPFAIILGCSDSRVPAELVFNQGLGSLFVIRIAGNIVAPSQIASIEFAIEQFDVRLVVVLGHSHCGAVQATLNQLSLNQSERSVQLDSIIRHISPAIQDLSTDNNQTQDELLHQAVMANIDWSTQQLRNAIKNLQYLEHYQDVTIIGAHYSIENGCVTFIEDKSREELFSKTKILLNTKQSVIVPPKIMNTFQALQPLK